jgi:hypothetical protein
MAIRQFRFANEHGNPLTKHDTSNGAIPLPHGHEFAFLVLTIQGNDPSLRAVRELTAVEYALSFCIHDD